MDWARILAYITGTVEQELLFGEASLRPVLSEYLVHYHVARNHQGKDNVRLFPTATKAMDRVGGPVGCIERLGGLLKYYYREAACVF